MVAIGTAIALAFLAYEGIRGVSHLAEPARKRRRNRLTLASLQPGFGDLRVALNDEERLSTLLSQDRSITRSLPRDAGPLFSPEGVQEQILRNEVGSLLSRDDMQRAAEVASGPEVSLTQLMARAGL